MHSERKMIYSIVIPVYNSEKIVKKTVEQILAVADQYNYNFEIMLVNDSSPDDSWGVISKLAQKHENVRSINLLKNYGQHTAILAGFNYAQGDYIITIDDDLQNPPNEIVSLIRKVKEGDFDLVFGKFIQKKHPLYRRLGSKAIGYLNKKIFNKPEHIRLSNFRIIRRDLIDRVLHHRTNYPYIPGLLLMYAAKISNIDVLHIDRSEGKSNYTISKIISLVSRLLINYSSYPLRLISSIGLAVSLLSFVMGFYYLIIGLFHGSSVPGWTTLIVLISFLSGFIIALLGLIGEYLSRILDHLSNRPSFIVKEVVK